MNEARPYMTHTIAMALAAHWHPPTSSAALHVRPQAERNWQNRVLIKFRMVRKQALRYRLALLRHMLQCPASI